MLFGEPSHIYESAKQNTTLTMCPQDSGNSGKIFRSATQKTMMNMDTRTAADVTLLNNTPMMNGPIGNINKIWLTHKRASAAARKKRNRQRSCIRGTKAQKNHGCNGFLGSQDNPDIAIIEMIPQVTLPCNQMDVNKHMMPCLNTTAQNHRFEVAIVHAGQTVNITSEQSVLVQEGIMAIVDNIPSGEFVPRFDESYLYKGALNIVCADIESERWIWERASYIQNWEGWNLQIVRMDELIKFVEVMAYVSKPQPEDTNLIFRRLERQNPGLCTARWTVIERTAVESGTEYCLRLEVDEAALRILERLDMKPYLNMGRAKFDLI